MKDQRSRSHRSFEVFVVSALWLSPYLTESLHMWYTYNAWEGDVAGTIFGMKLERSKVKFTWAVSNFGLVHSVALSLFGWIISYVTYIQHMRGWCVAHHSQDERSKVKVTWVIWSFCPVRSWLPPYLTESLHNMWHKYNTWGGDVSCPISRMEGQRLRSHGSFQVLAIWWLRHAAAIRSVLEIQSKKL